MQTIQLFIAATHFPLPLYATFTPSSPPSPWPAPHWHSAVQLSPKPRPMQAASCSKSSRPRPRRSPAAPSIPAQTAAAALPADNTPVRVTGFAFEGNSVISSEALANLLADQRGDAVPFGQLRASLARINAAYAAQGYFLARALIPRQDLAGGGAGSGVGAGTLRIQILEGRLGQISSSLQGKPLETAQATLRAQGIVPGIALRQEALERSLLLISERVGAETSVALAPGSSTGSTDISLQTPVTPKNWSAQISLDNSGNRYSGELRALADLSVRHLATPGDALQLRSQLSSGIKNLNIGYSLPIGYDGLRLEVQASHLSYELCCQFAALQAEGSASQWGLALRYPLVLRAERSINLEGGYARRHSKDETFGATTADKIATPVHLALSFNDSSAAQGRLLQNGRVALIRGQLDQRVFVNPNTPKRYGKLQANYGASYFTGSSQWLFKANGQAAQTNLDSSEKLSLGGPNGVRGWPVGEASGDSGAVLSVEWRKPLGAQAGSGFTFSAFADTGQITQHNNLWPAALPAGQPNSYSLSSVGIGLAYQAGRNWSLSAQVARGLGKNPGRNLATGANSDGRTRNTQLWVNAVVGF
ncbi:MAG: ShlB/FhaC/HecB family hemolysin secretion/activation protein [Brachymonas sp.]|nr:ShlB/FhaC/HecB family hemolysin secretion/activation protein [Brachymonas sp.]